MIARLSPCRGFVELHGRLWSDRFPVGRLDAWRGFYRRLVDRKADRAAPRLRDTLAALDAVAEQLTREASA